MKKAPRVQRAESARTMINLRTDDELNAVIDELRSRRRPIPTITAIIKEAVEKLAAADGIPLKR